MKVHVLGYSLLLILIASLGFSTFGMTQQSRPEAPKRPKWEYKVVALEASGCSSDVQVADSLSTLGQQGWELVNYTRGTPSLPQNAEGTLLITAAAIGPSGDVTPPTADSFQGRINMKMSQTPPGDCLMILKREQLPPAAH